MAGGRGGQEEGSPLQQAASSAPHLEVSPESWPGICISTKFSFCIGGMSSGVPPPGPSAPHPKVALGF